MFPKHCKEVSVKRVTFPLTREDITRNLKNKQAYKKTRFLVLNNGDEWAVVRIKKNEPQDLFSKIVDIEIISLPETTKYLEGREIEVLSPTWMAEKAEEMSCETLVVKGKFEHVSFIHNEKSLPLMVIEVIPPEPAKLVEMVRAVLYSGNVPKAVKIIHHILDLREVEKDYNTQNIVFPCNASGLTSDKKTFYLDQRPNFSDQELRSITLIGCNLSLRIFKTLYGKEPGFYNFCPKKRALDMQPEYPVITKCCELKEGHERIGNLTFVPWGATAKEVEDALNDILPERQ